MPWLRKFQSVLDVRTMGGRTRKSRRRGRFSTGIMRKFQPELTGAILCAFLLPCVSGESLTNASSFLKERIEWIGWKPIEQ